MLELSEEDVVLGAGGLVGWAPLPHAVKFLDCRPAPTPPPEDSAWSPWARGGSEAPPTANQLSNSQLTRPQIQKKNRKRKESGASGW